ncbi:MFS transporter [Sphingomonas solaris]|uniref:MFS transporter n=1 Tax=Alterirhizorhabdus solaris TaxID=2529389 RepID=A0A558RB95_9SPHN|nr:MFS transporter [Sphingomonas solaris]TVV76656.1 MFS transporter [Sphingomonas solaris]
MQTSTGESPNAAERGHAPAPEGVERASPYAYYALAILVLANFLNYVDRHIVSIVGQKLKVDLALTDAQLGFLIGTAFAVFYGVVGIAMGRIADALSRTRLMALGLALWSGMTAVAGLATSFAWLAVARLGVGIGEAAANPCSHSLLSDYFPARNRSAVLAVYLLGTHLGAAASLIGGGLMLSHWDTICLSFPDGACGIANWRAAFFVTGAPGVLLALLVFFMREPRRATAVRKTGTLRLVILELSAAIPPLTLVNLYRIGGMPAVTRNLIFALIVIVIATGLSLTVGDWPQWAAVALGVYSVSTWAGVLRRRDTPLHRLTFGCPTFGYVAAGGALSTVVLGAAQAWSAPYVMRTLNATPAEAGVALGLAGATAAGISVVAGGIITDFWKRRDPRAPVWIALIALVVPVPAFVMMLRAETLAGYVAAYSVFMLISMLWAGGFAALVQDLVLQRMRGTAASAFSLIMILVGSGIGPYWVGKISGLTGSLATGMLSVLTLVPVAAVLLVMGARRLPAETRERRLALARAAGEPV